MSTADTIVSIPERINSRTEAIIAEFDIMVAFGEVGISGKEMDFLRTDMIIDVPDTTFFLDEYTFVPAVHYQAVRTGYRKMRSSGVKRIIPWMIA